MRLSGNSNATDAGEAERFHPLRLRLAGHRAAHPALGRAVAGRRGHHHDCAAHGERGWAGGLEDITVP